MPTLMNPMTRGAGHGWRRRVLAIGAAVFIWPVAHGSLHAQQPGNALAGRDLAAEWCASCHLIGPDVQRGATDVAPPFAVLAAEAQTTEFRLRAFLMTPHQRMPDFKLSREQTDDLIAYILGLRRR